MTTAYVNYPTLETGSLMHATWFPERNFIERIGRNYQGKIIETATGEGRLLHSIRNASYGQVLPHIYASDIIEYEAKNGAGRHDLSRLHGIVDDRYSLNGAYDHDSAGQNLELFLSQIERDEDYASILGEAQVLLSSYQALRETRMRQAATTLSALVTSKELYVAGSLMNDIPGERPLYAARLAGIAVRREDTGMIFEPIVQDGHGQEGFLPDDFAALGGVLAPATRI